MAKTNKTIEAALDKAKDTLAKASRQRERAVKLQVNSIADKTPELTKANVKLTDARSLLHRIRLSLNKQGVTLRLSRKKVTSTEENLVRLKQAEIDQQTQLDEIQNTIDHRVAEIREEVIAQLNESHPVSVM